MGNSFTTAHDVSARAAYRAASGTGFSYSATTAAAPPSARKVHEMLDPKRINTNGDKVRECLDSDEHPVTLPVVVAFDETASMGDVPRRLQASLATLKGVTLRAGLIDAQLCFGAYGDAANAEVAPVQIGHFESGLEMEEWLNNMYLEGNGGGNGGETAALLLWFLATHSKLDSIDKRGKKGYIFLTGDEITLNVTPEMVKTYIDEDIESTLTPEQVVAMVREYYEVYFLLVDNSTAKWQRSEAFWTNLLGEGYVIPVQDLDHISELISMILAREEDVVDDLDEAATLVLEEGGDRNKTNRAVKDLAVYEAHRGRSVAKVAKSSGSLAASAGDSSTERL